MHLLNLDAFVATCILIVGYIIVCDGTFTKRQRRILRWVFALLGLVFLFSYIIHYSIL